MKKLLNNTTAYVALAMSLVLFAGPGFSSDDVDEYKIVIQTAALNPTPKQVRAAVIKALIHYNWVIQTVNNNQITAKYRKYVKLDIKFTGNSSVSILMKPAANSKWLPRINQYVTKELRFHYYMQKL